MQEYTPENHSLPSPQETARSIRRSRAQKRRSRIAGRVAYKLLVVSAVVVLILNLWLPVLRITGISMEPTVLDGEYVMAVKTRSYEIGDIIAFRYDNRILVKRVIANAGDWVNIDLSGNVFVNNVPLQEPYIPEKSLGQCDIALPFQVPDGRIFVMGDDRPVSLDSRTSMVGTVGKDQLMGRVILRVWPLSQIGPVR